MSTFLCTRCGAIENTATSDYWIDMLDGRPVICSKCKTGVWHNKFPRTHWSKIGVGKILSQQKLDMGDFINGRHHLREIGVIGSKKNTYKEIPWED